MIWTVHIQQSRARQQAVFVGQDCILQAGFSTGLSRPYGRRLEIGSSKKQFGEVN
jgi:hypothetical protein